MSAELAASPLFPPLPLARSLRRDVLKSSSRSTFPANTNLFKEQVLAATFRSKSAHSSSSLFRTERRLSQSWTDRLRTFLRPTCEAIWLGWILPPPSTCRSSLCPRLCCLAHAVSRWQIRRSGPASAIFSFRDSTGVPCEAWKTSQLPRPGLDCGNGFANFGCRARAQAIFARTVTALGQFSHLRVPGWIFNCTSPDAGGAPHLCALWTAQTHVEVLR